MTRYIIVEKKDHLAVHAHCSTLESANNWLEVLAPQYCAKGYFMNKALTPNCFEVVVRSDQRRARAKI